ncbi:glycosyltransferase family 2 protein [Sphingomonas arenae]|uniref:glycosyltransferase family 2 protein n=1 Tax=Sphingomonas arenae TaxID=2812555 RepID=UPI0019685706|nr:glycosyltransferase family 2 protein [Sphingomonas arenae]
MSKGKRIFIVIPAYQAAKTIESVFDRLPPELSEKDVRILVVNDGSTDGTGEIVRSIVARRHDTELIEQPRNMGYAQAQKTGFQQALQQGADIVALLHADGQYAPELLLQLLEPLEKDQADVVQGSRMLNSQALRGGMPLYKFIANKALTAIENFAFGMNMGEYHSGYMLYSRRCLESIPFNRLSDTFHFDGEMLLMASKRKLRIKEVAIPTRYADEESHLKPVQYGFDVLRVVWRNARGQYSF